MIKRRFIGQGSTRKEIKEIYRMLQAMMNSMIEDKKLKVITYTSVIEDNDKSKHICNIAQSMAKEGKKILLIDCDMIHPQVHQCLGISNEKGLTSLCRISDYVKIVSRFPELPTFHILTAGPQEEEQTNPLDLKKVQMILDNIKEFYDLIFINAPPAGAVVEGIKLSEMADGTVLVMTTGKTPLDEATKVKEMLETVKANVIGVILEKS